VDDELKELVRRSVNQALTVSPGKLGAALAEFGWDQLVSTDEPFAFTTLFEAQGYLGSDTDALDVVTVAALDSDGPAHLVWPLDAAASEMPAPDEVTADGVSLRGTSDPGSPILVPAGERLFAVQPSSLDETPMTGMARDLMWVRVRVRGVRITDLGAWSAIERRARLALASELVGVTQRILDTAVTHAVERRQFGRPIGANQAVRHRLAEAYSDLVGARALVAAAWEDGTPSAAAYAKAVAGTAHDAVAKQAIQVCGAIGLSEEHPLPRLVRRGFALDALLGSATTRAGSLGSEGIASARPDAVASF
jgi:hypothetical protein